MSKVSEKNLHNYYLKTVKLPFASLIPYQPKELKVVKNSKILELAEATRVAVNNRLA